LTDDVTRSSDVTNAAQKSIGKQVGTVHNRAIEME